MTDVWGRPGESYPDTAGPAPRWPTQAGNRPVAVTGPLYADERDDYDPDGHRSDGHRSDSYRSDSRRSDGYADPQRPPQPAPSSQPGRAESRHAAGPAGGTAAGPEAGHGTDGRRTRGGAGAPGQPAALVALLLLGLPVLGAIVSGGTPGLALTVGSVLGAAAAALLSSRSGLWWVVTATPVVVLAVAMAEQVMGGGDTSTSAALATHSLAWSARAFDPVALATAAALAVTVVRAVRSGNRKGADRG